jgi:hypothetical protein
MRAGAPSRGWRCASKLGRLATCVLVGLLAPGVAIAAPGDAEAKKGLAAAKRGDCVAAVPLLEDAELTRHRPSTAVALADCYVSLGDLLRAAELFHAVADEQPIRSWTRADREAVRKAPDKAREVDERIPTLRIRLADAYPELEVEVDGRPITELDKPMQVPPDLSIAVVVRASGRREHQEKVVLGEGERRTLVVRLGPSAGPVSGPDTADEPPPPKTGDKPPQNWIGGRFRGITVPQFMMNFFGDGGTTVFAPGGVFTFTTAASDADVVIGLGYASYRMGATPYKPKGTPPTEWEIIESDLMALYATVDLIWSVPLDDAGRWSFRFGGGVGVGWTFAGDLYRTQAYLPDGAPDDPSALVKCDGPNDPAGTYEYCNQLDKDFNHYDGFAEPSWFSGGARPLVFPWLAFPLIGLSYRASRTVMIDLEAGVSLTGILGSAGMRFGL